MTQETQTDVKKPAKADPELAAADAQIAARFAEKEAGLKAQAYKEGMDRAFEMFWAQKAAGSTPSGYYGHGPGGLLSTPGARPGVVNAMVMPVPGLRGKLRIRPSIETNPILTILTGQTASTGSEPTAACADGKQPGQLKICRQSLPFGRRVMDSQILQVDQIGQIVNRGEFRDQVLIGSLGNPDAARPIVVSPRDALRSETKKKILELQIALVQDYAEDVWDGTPVATPGTGYIQYYGLQSQINTGHQDALTQQACPAADSYVFDVNGGIDANLILRIVETYRSRKYLAKQTGLEPVQFAFVGRYGMFIALTEAWPCVYYTARCQTVGSTTIDRVNLDAVRMTEMIQEMRQGEYLLIDGEKVPFVVDDALAEDVIGANTFESDLWLVPMSSPKFAETGGLITYMEHFDLSSPYAAVEVVKEFAPNSYEVLGNGQWLLHFKPPTNECVQIRMLTRERIVVEAPFLGARLTDVQYAFLIHERDYRQAGTYHVDGGLYTLTPQTFYAPTA